MYNPIYNKRTINQPLQYLIDLDWFASWSLTAPRWLCKKVWIFGGATTWCNRLKYLELHHETRRTTADLHKNQRLWLIIWLVVWNMLYFSISYMGCYPSHWRTHIFQRGRYTNNQMMFDHVSIQEDLPTYWVDMCSGDHCEGHVPWGVSLLAQCARRGEWIQLLHWSSPKFERICQVHHNESPDNDVYFAMKESRIVSHRMWTSLRIQSETRATMVPTFGRQLYRHMTWAGTSTLNITSSSGCLLFHFIYVVLKRD